MRPLPATKPRSRLKLAIHHVLALLWLLTLVPLETKAASFADDFAVVFIDAQTEAKYGKFPLDRKLIGDALDKLAEAKARGVVLKFFYDQPKDATSDAHLAKAMTRLPVILQARMNDTEAHPNPLPTQFTLPRVKAETAVTGKSGWIPLPIFTEHARDVGFVDSASTTVPLIETYQGQTVKSLWLCSCELALGQSANIEPGTRITFGKKVLPLDSKNQFTAPLPKQDALKYIPFHTLLDGTVPVGTLRGKVVILGYDGPGIHSFETPIGKIKAHRLFVYALQGIYEQSQENSEK